MRSCGSVAAAWSFLFAGLVAWMRRPQNRLGPLMVAACFALLARQFRYSHNELAFTVFFVLGELGWALFAHVTFAYPFGRVTDRVERAFLWVAYVVAVAFPLAILLFYGGSERLRYLDPFPRESLLLVSDDPRRRLSAGCLRRCRVRRARDDVRRPRPTEVPARDPARAARPLRS